MKSVDKIRMGPWRKHVEAWKITQPFSSDVESCHIQMKCLTFSEGGQGTNVKGIGSPWFIKTRRMNVLHSHSGLHESQSVVILDESSIWLSLQAELIHLEWSKTLISNQLENIYRASWTGTDSLVWNSNENFMASSEMSSRRKSPSKPREVYRQPPLCLTPLAYRILFFL